MIVCGKCGFTQPRDVYCANCGVNLEKYRPEQPSKWVRILKDPISQITIAIIAAVAVFFIVINKPSPDALSVSENDAVVPDEVIETLKKEPAKKTKLKLTKTIKKPNQNNVKVVEKTATVSAAEIPESQKADFFEDSTEDVYEDEGAEGAVAKKVEPLVGAIHFYEILPNQLEKYFPSTARVQASVVTSNEIDFQSANFNKIPNEGRWDTGNKKSYVIDYMLEPIEGGDAQGIKIVVKKIEGETNESGAEKIEITVTANIPSQDGRDTSIDWTRFVYAQVGNSVLVKIRLPDSEPPSSFLEENFNSPLSIMANPQYSEQKLQLLMLLKF